MRKFKFAELILTVVLMISYGVMTVLGFTHRIGVDLHDMQIRFGTVSGTMTVVLLIMVIEVVGDLRYESK